MPLAGVLTSVLVVAYLVDRRLLLRRQVRQLPQRVWLLTQQGLEGVWLRGDVEVELEVVEHGGFWLVAEGKLGSAGSALLDFCVHEAVASSFGPIPGIGFVVVDLVCLLAILFLLLDVFYDLAELLLELRGFFALLGLFGLFDDFVCVLFEGELPE